MSDDQILEQIYQTHVHSDKKFDVNSLFTLVDNILGRSTHIVDNVVQRSLGNQDSIDDKIHPANFSSPLCTLKQIAFEMSCKLPGDEIPHKTTLAILNKLSDYSWEAKAVLTLAAFALDYGEFWLLSQLQPTDLLAKSLAVLKRVPVLTKLAALPKHSQAIAEFNNLIKTTLQVVEVIFELERLSLNYDTKKVPALALARDQIPIYVYWAIITVVAVVTQIDCLTTDSEHRQDLSHFGQKINITLSNLRKQITHCKQQKEEVEYFANIRKLLETPTEVLEVIKLLIFPAKDVPQELFDGATKEKVNIDVLKRKNIFLFISTLDITEEEISVLRPVYDRIKNDDQYKIVWIPIEKEGEWNENLKKKFETLKSKMSWYVVHQFAFTAGYKFIKEEWHFKKKPMVLVMNHQAKVENTDAFHAMNAYGTMAFPFRRANIDEVTDWVKPVIGSLDPIIATWIKQEEYIFFYGGNDEKWIQEFRNHATALANKEVIKKAKVSIQLFCVDKNLISKFWSRIESLFVTKVHKILDAVTQEVQKMLSCKNKTEWALFIKGSAVVLSGDGETILQALTDFEKWKESAATEGFEIAFKKHYKSIVSPSCFHLEIPNVAGTLPESIKCPECPRLMETYIHYKCCHNESPTANAAH